MPRVYATSYHMAAVIGSSPPPANMLPPLHSLLVYMGTLPNPDINPDNIIWLFSPFFLFLKALLLRKLNLSLTSKLTQWLKIAFSISAPYQKWSLLFLWEIMKLPFMLLFPPAWTTAVHLLHWFQSVLPVPSPACSKYCCFSSSQAPKKQIILHPF